MDMSRISACSYPLRERPWQEALAVIAGAGFDKVDLLGRAPHLSLDPDECDPTVIKLAANALGVQIANLGTYAGRGFASENATERERELEQLQRAIDVAALLGSRSIRVMPGDDDPDKIPQIAEWFRRGARYAAERGVYMGYTWATRHTAAASRGIRSTASPWPIRRAPLTLESCTIRATLWPRASTIAWRSGPCASTSSMFT